ncbi:recombinase RecT, partial [Yersinia pestis]
MSRSEVEKVRDATAKKDRDGKPKVPAVWQKWFDRMALKTVLHRLARRLPCASELYSLLDVNQIADEAEKPQSVAHSAKAR